MKPTFENPRYRNDPNRGYGQLADALRAAQRIKHEDRELPVETNIARLGQASEAGAGIESQLGVEAGSSVPIGQLTAAQFEYLFGSANHDHARKTVRTWAEWEAFLAHRDAEHPSDESEMNSTERRRQYQQKERRGPPVRRGRPFSINGLGTRRDNTDLFT